MNTKCYVVDDELNQGALFYSAADRAGLSDPRNKSYSFSAIIDLSISDALNSFGTGTIDLFHLNVFRNEFEVRQILEAWKIKLSANAFVLLDNTEVREKGYSIWKLWQEILGQYPNALSFSQHRGLGVWCIDNKTQPFEFLQGLDNDSFVTYFTDLGNLQLLGLKSLEYARTQALQVQELSDEAREAFYRQQTLESKVQELEKAHSDTQTTLKSYEIENQQTERDRIQLQMLNAELRTEKQDAIVAKFHALKERELFEQKATQAQQEFKSALDELVVNRLQTEEATLAKARAEALAHQEHYRADTEAEHARFERGQKVQAEETVELLAGEAKFLREIVASAEKWQKRSWFKRAFHKWRADSQKRLAKSEPVVAVARETVRELISPQLAEIPLSKKREIEPSAYDVKSLIDSKWYFETYPEVVLTRLTAHEHYLDRGVAENKNPNPYFDTDWYLKTYLDVGKTETNPLVHYCETGWKEHRNPSLKFDTEFYLSTYPDVVQEAINPLLHFLSDGIKEGRLPKPISLLEQSDEPFKTSYGTPTVIKQSIKGKILYISGEPKFAGHYYRVENYAKAFLIIGWLVEWMAIDDLSTNCEILGHSFDMLVLWRAAYSPTVERVIQAFKNQKKIVVFDVDDLMFDASLAKTEIIDGIRTQDITESQAAAIFANVRTTLSLSDYGFVPTEELAHQIYLTGRPAYVLPNGFDDGVFRRSAIALNSRKYDSDIVRIGYAGGSKTHQKDFGCVADALVEILKKYHQVRLVLFRNSNGPLVDLSEFSDLLKFTEQIEWRDAVALQDLPAEMARFDINTAPLDAGNVFCEAKSELKFFEAALLRIPTIASPTEPYRSCIDDGKNGYLASNRDEWIARFEKLIENPALRTELGTAAYVTALAKFGTFARAFRLGAVMDQVLGKGRTAEGFSRYVQLNSQIEKKKLPECRPYSLRFVSGSRGKSDVSVVITLFNYQDFINDALESVLAQTLPCDLVVIDDQSTDSSLSKVLEWLEIHAKQFTHVTVAQHTLNSGLACTRNLGFLLCQTPYAISLDADNKLLPRCAEELLHGIKSGNHAFAYPTIQCIGDYEGPMGNTPYQPQRLTHLNFIDNMAMVSLEAWAIVGGYSKYQEHGWEDYDLWSKLAEIGLGGIWIDKTLALYRIHHTSMMRTASRIIERKKSLVGEFKSKHPWARTRETEW